MSDLLPVPPGASAATALDAGGRALLRGPWRRKNRRPRTLAAVGVALALLAVARPDPASLALGTALVVAGQGLRLLAAGYLVKTRELAVSGPYRHLRHPLYAGVLLVGAGFILAAGPGVARVALPLGLAFFLGYYLPYKERVESKRLEAVHGPVFTAYRAAVPALLPRLRPWRDGAPGAPWSFARLVANDELGAALATALFLAALAARTWLPAGC